MILVLAIFLSLLTLGWLISLALTLHSLYYQENLLPNTDLRLTAVNAPLVSILVPARNEAHRVLADCIRSILAQDYGRFEVIAVNDRCNEVNGA
jgi:cellulose synthase/poly-beta-1,6-N-acetylglucosamine synthase-like glycosyltransferase